GGGNVATANFGFSFNVVTNTLAGDNTDHDGVATARTVQGSLRQFIQNANAIAGPNAMRFVPASAPNVQTGGYIDDANYTNDGGDDWWQITVTTALPQITTQTTIDGTAYSRFDGTSPADTNQGVLGYAGAVGLGADGIAGTGDDPAPLAGVARPELEIVEGGAAQIAVGLDLQANNITVRGISIHGFGNDNTVTGGIEDQADIRIGVDVPATDTGSTFSASGIVIEESVIGLGPSSLLDPGVNNRSLNGILVAGPDGGTIRNNLIGSVGQFGIFLTDNADGWTIQGNDIGQNGRENSGRDGIDIGNLSGGAIISRNYFSQNQGGGVDSYRSDGGNLIENNTFVGNGQGGTEPTGIRLYGTGSTVQLNWIELSGTFSAPGAGVLVARNDGTTNTPATGNLVSRNSFNANWSNAIDLNTGAGSNITGDGINLNDGVTNASTGNIGVDFPLITSANLSGGTTTISGTAATGVTSVEVYRAFAGAGDSNGGNDYGEGLQYLGTAAVVAGNWSLIATGLVAGERVSAIGIDGSNNTSEFGRNLTVTSAGSSISGTIWNDTDADADVTLAEGHPGLSGVTVHLFRDTAGGGAGTPDATDVWVATTTTNLSGVYTFTGQPDATYWVAVDSKTLSG
ncbi:MAG: right-handed parallel beta-helix repeat-containing protein, partial [Gammaproteobacteria bacterium]